MFVRGETPGTFRLDYEWRWRVRFSNFKQATFSEPALFMLVLGREGSSWDETCI